MTIGFPSVEFDEAVGAVCHGQASEPQVRALNELLRTNARARDEYILRVELHSRLASDPDLFAAAEAAASAFDAAARPRSRPGAKKAGAMLALAASVAIFAAIVWSIWFREGRSSVGPASRAVAMLNGTAGAQWAGQGDGPRLGAPLEPGWLKLDAGLAQIVFYSGARVAIEGPAEILLLSASHVLCRRGKITAEVPPQARGFRIDTPQGQVTDLGTEFGLEVSERRTEVHVFTGEVVVQTPAAKADENVQEGSGAVIENSRAPRRVAADRTAFASLFDLQAKSSAAEAQRLHQWQAAGERLNRDASLVVRFDFEDAGPSNWQLRNIAAQSATSGDATIVGCRWGEGRWPEKRALQFQGVSDRVRMNVPGEFESLTLSAWVQVHGLDRMLNALFMCDGFGAGTVHWLIRNDGVLGLTVAGEGTGKHQIVASPPVLTLDQFGLWVHLAVVVDGHSGRVVHYVNGRSVGEKALKIKPPYRVGTAELGNWNAKDYPVKDPIRNFSGAMDEFCLFNRALDDREIQALYAGGKPEADVVAATSP